MMNERRGRKLLEPWMATAAATGEPALRSFVTGLRADQDAVTNGLSLRWSSGSVEGHVNRIKMLKRPAGGEHAGTVGCHPPELLVIELDQHPRGQRVDPRQQRVALPGVPIAGRQHVAGRDQPGQGRRQPPVPAVTEVGTYAFR
jgi:hypothetical protein